MGRTVGALGIRPADVGLTLAAAGAVELSVAVGGGFGAAPLNALAYLLGAALTLPILARRRWPLQVLLACTALLLAYYSLGYRRNISPAPLLAVPVYDAAVAGYLAWAIVIPSIYMTIGLVVVDLGSHPKPVTLAADFLPSFAVLALAITLGEVARGRRALTAETARALRAAQEERESEAARRVAEERLRIARDLHDTVAHSMATITVQAGSALHLLGDGDERLRAALGAIRDTSREALRDMRSTLAGLRDGGLRDGGRPGGGRDDASGVGVGHGGLDRLPTLRDAVAAAGAPVTLTVDGAARALPPAVDEAAYRIVQESLTNVLRHAGPAARADVRLRYEPTALSILVADDGSGQDAPSAAEAAQAGGHGLAGMAERVAVLRGQVSAGPRPEGGFQVSAWLPLPPLSEAQTAGPAGRKARADDPAAGAAGADRAAGQVSG